MYKLITKVETNYKFLFIATFAAFLGASAIALTAINNI